MPAVGDRVRIYWNLHKMTFSVMHKGLVIGYAHEIYLHDAKFIVSEAGRQRCLREGRKNVHAYIEGALQPMDRCALGEEGSSPCLAHYNPKRAGMFTTRVGGVVPSVGIKEAVNVLAFHSDTATRPTIMAAGIPQTFDL